jgi:hypothetical protein
MIFSVFVSDTVKFEPAIVPVYTNLLGLSIRKAMANIFVLSSEINKEDHIFYKYGGLEL